MSSPKLFSEKLNKINEASERAQSECAQLDKRLTDVEAKIKQLIDEITPILTSHANALKELSSFIAAINKNHC